MVLLNHHILLIVKLYSTLLRRGIAVIFDLVVCVGSTSTNNEETFLSDVSYGHTIAPQRQMVSIRSIVHDPLTTIENKKTFLQDFLIIQNRML